MGARAEKLIEEDGYVHGVRYRGQDGWHELRAVLTKGADGRFSRIRKLAGAGAGENICADGCALVPAPSRYERLRAVRISRWTRPLPGEAGPGRRLAGWLHHSQRD